MVTLSTVSPSSGPPGTVITCTGTGFTTGSRVACPSAVPTTYVDVTTVTAEIPTIDGAAGTTITVSVLVMGEDGSTSAVQLFSVVMEPDGSQTWTSVEKVAGEVPGFLRGGRITDQHIATWMRSVAQEITAEMLRRGLSLNPADWQQPGVNAAPDPADMLEMINRAGAAARLAGAISGQMGPGEWGLAKNLERTYLRQLGCLANGDYDKLFAPGAATVVSGQLFGAGDMTRCDGSEDNAFRKDKRF